MIQPKALPQTHSLGVKISPSGLKAIPSSKNSKVMNLCLAPDTAPARRVAN